MKMKDNGYKHPRKKCCFFRATQASTAITEQVGFLILPMYRATSIGVGLLASLMTLTANASCMGMIFIR